MTDTARRCSCNRRINRAAPHLRRDGPNKSCRGSDHPATPSLGRVRRACTASGLSPEEGAERLSVRLRGILPVGLDWTPALAEPFLVGVAVLRNDGRDPLRVADGKPKTCWRTVVEDVRRKPIEADDLGEEVDHTGNVVERVTEFF